MTHEENIQQRYLQFKQLQQQLGNLQEYREALQQQQLELEKSIAGIQELQSVSLNTEMLAPIANGIFVKTQLRNNKELIVNVGANVTVEKSIPDVLTLLEQQQTELNEKIPMTDAVVQELQQQAQKVYEQLKETSEKE